MQTEIVRSIDLGYGFVKYVHNVNKDGVPFIKSFPSIVEVSTDKNLGGDYFQRRKTTVVRVENVDYEVGEDIDLTTNGYSKKVLSRQYINSVDYEALMKGALKLMRVPEIDMLVIGVPVDVHQKIQDTISAKWKGEIDLDGTKKVVVKKVACVPQPLGGFAYHGTLLKKYSEIKELRNLIIDPGYFTFDWLLSDGMSIVNSSSGSYEGGMHFLIKAVVDQLGTEANNLTTIKRIDEYFYKGKQFMYEGKVVDLAPYQDKVQRIIQRTVQEMITTLTNIQNIDKIILVGGASMMYLEEIKKQFKGRVIESCENTENANVLGFQIIGESSIG
jgi:plasmid segregation protein ParM